MIVSTRESQVRMFDVEGAPIRQEPRVATQIAVKVQGTLKQKVIENQIAQMNQ